MRLKRDVRMCHQGFQPGRGDPIDRLVGNLLREAHPVTARLAYGRAHLGF